MFHTQTMTSHGGRQIHCTHRTEGVCATKAGNAKRACWDQISAQVGATERLINDADQVWVFPSAQALFTAQRANYDAQPKDPRLTTAIARARAAKAGSNA